ncbi:hypothetical protein N7539_005301 [Penicillium diatomitis]|uniref:Uncharacterized protein n=1 Tax=Penicillium diatomitis TaxID=2819901 RepID=A0A9W9X6D0_9EURO|nr:uncharacterized protein N7539_005301 [Penicillium diatomitis]KAJ5485313.1 hypothetical protein N7539_005301 [Penicillium diatomitis]
MDPGRLALDREDSPLGQRTVQHAVTIVPPQIPLWQLDSSPLTSCVSKLAGASLDPVRGSPPSLLSLDGEGPQPRKRIRSHWNAGSTA